MKDSFYEELEWVLNIFPKYHMNILLGDFCAKVNEEDIFKPALIYKAKQVKTFTSHK
jgi:hypothetical protein